MFPDVRFLLIDDLHFPPLDPPRESYLRIYVVLFCVDFMASLICYPNYQEQQITLWVLSIQTRSQGEM